MMTGTSDRILMLDVIRGVAVMGILLANLPAFALVEGAYFSPLPAGGTGLADRIAWTLNFVLVEGKMRGLFSLLFGASMLLVVERARAAGASGAATHYRRMATLFAIGAAHLYLLWWGDILTHYALVGAVAFLFAGLPVPKLLAAGAVSILVGWGFSVGGAFLGFSDTADAADLLRGFGAPDPARAASEVAATLDGWWTGVAWRWTNAADPIGFLIYGGPDTLGLMLWGMAGLKSGFLTGGWDLRRYKRWAAVTLAIGWASYAALAVLTLSRGFDPRFVLLGSIAASAPFRLLLIIGYACLVMLLMRPGGRLTTRIAAAGRAAFTNYLGTTVLMTFVFHGWGLGLFNRVGRAEMYWLAPLAWAVMLAWSKPWLDRHRHGPTEWLWRRLARVRPARTSS